MMRKILLLFLLLAVVMLALAPLTHVQAAGLRDTPTPPEDDTPEPTGTNYCEGGAYSEERCKTIFEGLTNLINQWSTSGAVVIARTVVSIFWLIARLALQIFDMAVNSTLIALIRDNLLTNLQGFMPGVLRNVALGGNGLMYLALVLAGVLMTVPAMQAMGSRLVRPERVLLWGVLLIALFVSGSFGYDLISGLEALRQEMMLTMLGEQAADSAEALALRPMRADDAEVSFDDFLSLPEAFEHAYYPEMDQWEISIKLLESGWMSVINTTVEEPDSRLARVQGAVVSLFYGLLTLLGGILLLSFATGFLFLNIAALVLILFLFAALPLGFFEFGNLVLTNLLQRYFQIVVYSLGLALLMRISIELILAVLPGDLASLSAGLEWGLLLVIFVLSVRMVTNSAWQTMLQSFGAWKSSLSSGMALNQGPGPGQFLDPAKQAALDVGKQAWRGAVLTKAVTGAALLGAGMVTGTAALTVVGAKKLGQSIGNVFVNDGQQPPTAVSPGNPEIASGLTPYSPVVTRYVSASPQLESPISESGPVPNIYAAPPANPGTTAATRPGFVAQSATQPEARPETRAAAPRSATPSPAAADLPSESARQAMEQARIFTPDAPGGAE